MKKKIDEDSDEELETPSPPDKGLVRPSSGTAASVASAPTPAASAVAAQREAALREKEKLLGKARAFLEKR